MKSFSLIFLFISTIAFSQQLEKVDFKNATAQLSIDANARKVKGKVVYDFELLSAIDTIKIDAQQMTFSDLMINNKLVQFKNSGRQLQLFEGFAKGKNTLTFDYEANPKQTMYFIGSENLDNLQIWTQGQGKYTSHWFPSFDDVNEKVIFNLNVAFDKRYQVISNGVLDKKIDTGNEILWQYRMKKPMSSYLLMLAIGQFQETKLTAKSDTPLHLYIEQEDTAKQEATYRYSKTIFDFFEKEIGVKYPWEVYKQIPVRDFLYAGMENTSATVFSRDFVVDEIGFNDKNYVNVNAHELAHQWFGDMVTAETSKHHWLQEGFATYYALLAEKKVFGEDYFYYKLYQTSLQLKEAAVHDTIPLLNEKASSLTFYQKGAWALHVLREGVGEKIFKKAVKSYLKKYAFQTVNTDDFLIEVKKLSKYDLNTFTKEWLQDNGFNTHKANELLLKNKNIKALFAIQELRAKPFKEKKIIFEKALQADVYFPVKEAVVLQLENVPFEEKESLLRLAMQTNNIQVRQAIVKTMPKIPLPFKKDYYNFLNDKSYITQEIALNVYWSQFPEEQKELLNKSKTWIGFNDKNLRILWLTLALGTKDYETQNKAKFYDELLDYCSPKFESSIRQNAMENLLFVNKNDKNVLPYLANAATSHRWQFNKFAREKIRLLLKNRNHRTYFEELLPKLPVNETNVLQKILSEK
ncbi:M1 family metallopeptidase [Flavobacterium sp. GT3R68]|uniref:M1 family metallopeptidase n=1 Tax=Flavobacterium sp. GT3R68 TaxID=2594437 RepID=UPI000F894761|nr:M1 family metallopeptidase [Flavobacterium sp. GT3R68]RTY94977.1 M1 family peptidase [Flavobacterium sp. GSN2]TRW91782.1 M1 family metallopeptidase [Flavobacterium sp. GT3R68]